ncbi:MAG: hypothetical protein E4H09_03735 [Spirochaetales bacterium]|nr:MAG: hypothetical protein E4H09_03735 [Spirochaetales bacterium]
MEQGQALPVAQDHSKATYTTLVSKDDGRIRWAAGAVHISRMVRALEPWPRAFTFFKGERLTILEARAVPGPSGNTAPGTVLRVDTAQGILVETGDGLLALQRLQLQSRKPLDWRSFSNGVHEFLGAVLGG